MPIMDLFKCDECDVPFQVARSEPTVACPICAVRFQIVRDSATKVAVQLLNLDKGEGVEP